jgi:acetolactate synthase I/II/III large subunit
MAETMNGAEWLARALASTGMSHVFFVESTLRRTLLALGDAGVKPILAHSEKAAAYMADGYARVAMRPGVCMAQSVGAANLASGLQDAYLGHSPVIAMTGLWPRYGSCSPEARLAAPTDCAMQMPGRIATRA